MNPFPLPLI